MISCSTTNLQVNAQRARKDHWSVSNWRCDLLNDDATFRALPSRSFLAIQLEGLQRRRKLPLRDCRLWIERLSVEQRPLVASWLCLFLAGAAPRLVVPSKVMRFLYQKRCGSFSYFWWSWPSFGQPPDLYSGLWVNWIYLICPGRFNEGHSVGMSLILTWI